MDSTLPLASSSTTSSSMVVALEEQADTSKAWVPDATARCSSSRSKSVGVFWFLLKDSIKGPTRTEEITVHPARAPHDQADPDWHHYCAAPRAVTAQSAHSRHLTPNFVSDLAQIILAPSTSMPPLDPT
ncbi:hypothetical protein J6590_044628 [Homalodisca vitripennis]|nr:hypothetical protein J6590_044628 [Homalodisca vitripennis]